MRKKAPEHQGPGVFCVALAALRQAQDLAHLAGLMVSFTVPVRCSTEMKS